MSIRPILKWFLGSVLLMASVAEAQQTPQVYDNEYAYGNAPYSNAAPSQGRAMSPLSPVGFVQDAQPFAPADISDYGNGPKPHNGFFFNYDRLFMSISRPATATVGNDGQEGVYIENGTPVFETNSLDTSVFKSKFGWGNRWELGYVDVNDYGWFVGILDHVAQSQSVLTHGVQVLMADPNNILFGFQDANGDGVPDSVVPTKIFPRFENLVIENTTLLNGVEIMRSYRAPRLHDGSTLDVYFGARFFQVDDRFHVNSFNNRFQGNLNFVYIPLDPAGTNTEIDITQGTIGPPLTTGAGTVTLGTVIPLGSTLPVFDTQFSVLDDISIRTRVQNNIVGPQIAFRWEKQRGRSTFSTEGKFMAGVNSIHITQESSVATQYFDQGTARAYFIRSSDQLGQPIFIQVLGQTFPNFAPGINQVNNLYPQSTRVTKNVTTFAPMGELKLNWSYELTRSVALNVGYSAMFLNGIARASNRVDYTFPRFGIKDGGTHQNLVVNGLNFGIVYNR